MSDASDWPAAPVPLTCPDPDPLPLDVLPWGLRAHAESVAGATQTPPDMAGLLGLGCVSAACGGTDVSVDQRGWTELAALYMGIVLVPGARKSPTFKAMTEPITAWERDELLRVGPEYRRAKDLAETAAAALAAAKSGAAKGAKGAGRISLEAENAIQAARDQLDSAEAAVPTLPRVLASDATPEALVRLLAAHGGRIALLAPEGDPLRISDGRYDAAGAARLDELKRAWCGDAIRVDRVSRDPVFIERPALTLALTMQPGVLESLRHRGAFRGEGVLARFLWCVPDAGLGRRATGRDVPALDTAAAERYARILRRLLDACASERHTLSVAPAALDALYAFEAHIEAGLGTDGFFADIADAAAKAHGQAVRLAALLDLARRAESGGIDWAEPIGAWAMAGAVRLTTALLTHARIVLASPRRRRAGRVHRPAGPPSCPTLREPCGRCSSG